METQKLITNPISRETSIREQLHQEIEEAPDEILATALDFLVFLKSRYSSPPTSTKVPSTAGSLLKTLERIGKWEGDDFDECLELVHASRGRLYLAIDEEYIEDLETDQNLFTMERVTDKLNKYKQIVQQLLLGYAETKPANGEFEVETIFDTERNHYQIVHLGWQNQRWVHHCPIHLDIRNEKIWIFYNSTEHDIALDLVDLGVPKQDIVLGFYPPVMRKMSDYAVG